MREILFKAKRIDNGEWVEGWIVPTMSNTYHDGYRIIDVRGINYDELDFYEPSFISWEVDKDTICQYTGLTDKNGNKIWENDILMFHSNKDDLAKACYGEFYVIDANSLEKIDSVIGWHYEVIETDAISKYEPFNISMPLTNDYIKTCEMEVIGNIFDNKDLIGE